MKKKYIFTVAVMGMATLLGACNQGRRVVDSKLEDTANTTNVEYPIGLPQELQQMPDTDGLPTPEYAYTKGETTVNVHLMGYRQGCSKEIKQTAISPFEEQRHIKLTLDTLTGTTKFVQYGTCWIVPTPDFSHTGYGYFFTAPGETVDLYVNLAFVNKQYKQDKCPPIKGCWTKGSTYDALNNLPHHTCSLPDSLAVRVRFGMTADELTEALLSHYRTMIGYIDAQAWHPWLKALKKAEVFHESLFQLVLDDRYYSEGGAGYPADYVHAPILTRHFDKLFEQADPDNQWLLLAPSEISLSELATRIKPENCHKTLTRWITAFEDVKQAEL